MKWSHSSVWFPCQEFTKDSRHSHGAIDLTKSCSSRFVFSLLTALLRHNFIEWASHIESIQLDKCGHMCHDPSGRGTFSISCIFSPSSFPAPHHLVPPTSPSTPTLCFQILICFLTRSLAFLEFYMDRNIQYKFFCLAVFTPVKLFLDPFMLCMAVIRSFLLLCNIPFGGSIVACLFTQLLIENRVVSSLGTATVFPKVIITCHIWTNTVKYF